MNNYIRESPLLKLGRGSALRHPRYMFLILKKSGVEKHDKNENTKGMLEMNSVL